MELLERKEVGDDVVYRYRVHYASKTGRVVIAIAPDGKIAQLGIQQEPPQ